MPPPGDFLNNQRDGYLLCPAEMAEMAEIPHVPYLYSVHYISTCI